MKFGCRLFMTAAALLLGWSVLAFAEQHPPVTMRVLNLSSQPITAFSIVGMPFRNIGLDVRPGETLTPAFGNGQMKYEIYWRLQDRTVHGAALDLRNELPPSFYGDVLISIHEDRVAVSWSNIDPAWIEYRRAGNPQKVAKPTVPLYQGCSGEVLTDSIALKAWSEAAERTRRRIDASRIEQEMLRGTCMLDWYVASPPDRGRQTMNEETSLQLREEWKQEIENYKSSR